MLLAGIVCTTLAACGGSDGGDAPTTNSAAGDGQGATTTVTVGLVGNVDVAPVYVGMKQGIFAKHGLKVDPRIASAGAAIVPAVVSGQYQFGYGSIIPLLIASSKGLPLKAVAAGNQEAKTEDEAFIALVVKKGSPIKRLEDLAGKKVGVNAVKSISELAIRGALEAKDVKLSSPVEYVEVPGPDMAAALSAGRVDAVLVAEPFLTAQKDDVDVVSKALWEATPGATVGLYYTSRPFAEKNGDTVTRFRDAINESLEYTSAHPDEARQAVVEYAKVPEAVAAEMLLPGWSTDMLPDSVKQTAEMMQRFEFAPKVDASTLLD